MSILARIIGFMITMWLFSIAFSQKNNIENDNNDKIVLEYSKGVKKVMIICAIFSFAFTLFFIIISISTKEVYIGQQILGLILAILSLLLYIALTNEKVIFDNNKFYSYNFFGKQKVHEFQDIIKVDFQESKGIMIVFKDKSNIKFSMLMNNYTRIEKLILNSDYYKNNNK